MDNQDREALARLLHADPSIQHGPKYDRCYLIADRLIAAGVGFRPALDVAALLDGIREEVREAVDEGDAQDCSSSECIADAVYEIVRTRLRAAVAAKSQAGG